VSFRDQEENHHFLYSRSCRGCGLEWASELDCRCCGTKRGTCGSVEFLRELV